MAAALLFWRLGAIYLWQDEANTAVLAVRMLETGKPLAYDGKNLLTNDNFAAENTSTIGERTTSAAAGVKYILERGDLRPDSSWVFQPWGQFVAAAASIRLFGRTTVAPRLPFALAGFAAVLMLFWILRRAVTVPHVALLSCALLATNAGWILHSRQARYYALSGLFLLLTVAAYDRWNRRARVGAAAFVVVAWIWFQIDYGTFWPVVAVLFVDAVTRHRESLRSVLLPMAILGAAIAPFVVFYQLFGRLSVQFGSWAYRAGQNLFVVNRFVVPLVILVAAGWLLVRYRQNIPDAERRFVTLSIAIIVALLLWVPTVAPDAYVRYVAMAIPLGAFLIAWTVMRLLGSRRPIVAWIVGGVIAITPWITLPLDWLAPVPPLAAGRSMVRPELRHAMSDVFVPRRDPNRTVIEWLRTATKPTDEILVNYEDVPMMYYLPNPIRGGVAAFRVEDHAAGPPAVIVLRRSVLFVHWPVFQREASRYDVEFVELGAPDVLWGNNPDPWGKIQDPNSSRDLLVTRVVGLRSP